MTEQLAEEPLFANPAPPPEVPERKFTQKEIGQMRRLYFTTTHGTVTVCGHLAKFSKTKAPKTNCVNCWEAFFMTSVDLDFIHSVLSTKGAKELEKIHGTKYVRMLHGFLSSKLLPMLAAETKVDPARIEGGTFDRNGEIQSSIPTIQNVG